MNSISAQIHDASDGANPGYVAHCEVSKVAVLPWPHVQDPASEVGVLKHQPVAFQHVARLAVGHVITIRDGFTVVHQLTVLASEVVPLVDPHPELSLVLQDTPTKKRKVCVDQSVINVLKTIGIMRQERMLSVMAMPIMPVRVVSPPQEDLVEVHDVWAVVRHKATVVHPAGIAAVQVHVDVGAVGAALIGPTLESLLLVQSNLKPD